MLIKNKVRIALLEFENKQSLNNTDKKVVNFILGKTLDEANSSELINRFLSIVNSKQRKFITAAVVTTLMLNPMFSRAYENASQENKNTISQFIKSEPKSEPKSDKETKKAEFSINFTNSFKSGAYDVNQKEVLNKLNTLKDFLSNNSNTKYSIKITASESQVPNQGNLKIGKLADMRSNVMLNLVKSYLKYNNLSLNVDKSTNIGNVPWDGNDKNDEKYTKDQYVKLEVFLDGENSSKPCEISFSKKDGVESTEKNGFLSFEQTLTESGEMQISPGSIPDRMVIYSDNNIIADTGYFVDKQHDYKEWNLVPLYIAELTEANIPNPKIPAMVGIKNLKQLNSFEELLNVLLKDKSYNYSKDRRNEIKSGIIRLKKLWDDGQREFVFYSTGNGNLKYNISNGKQAKVSVYSPLKKTGFNIKGKCN